MIGSTGNDGIKTVQIIVALKYLSNFWKTLEMLLNNCEINVIPTCSSNCVISSAAANQNTTSAGNFSNFIKIMQNYHNN